MRAVVKGENDGTGQENARRAAGHHSAEYGLSVTDRRPEHDKNKPRIIEARFYFSLKTFYLMQERLWTSLRVGVDAYLYLLVN